ncbi:MAG: hypothetical protein KGL39_54575 [Patescibacteria group bacterium]|nr:hypothetical protein [Patescibacteria group bacterium]
MPCDQIITQSFAFEGASKHLDLLAEALRECGYQVRQTGERIEFERGGVYGTFENGRFSTNGQYGENFDVDQVKRSFSAAAVRKVANKHGWQIVPGAANRLKIRKRSF